MSKSLDRVLQPDGSYKWQETELIHSGKVVEPEVCPAPEPLVPGELAIDETAPEEGILTANLKINHIIYLYFMFSWHYLQASNGTNKR